MDIKEFSDGEHDGDEDYQKLFQESIRMSKIREKRSLRLKAMEGKNISLQATLIDSQSKVKQLEEQCTILSNKLIIAGQENDRQQQSQKVDA